MVPEQSLDQVKQYCFNTYETIYKNAVERLQEGASLPAGTSISVKKQQEIENAAQKEAIKETTLDAMRKFPGVDVASIWRAVYETHVHRKSGIDNSDVIGKVISADQSWKKSSGHAFEEMIKSIANQALQGTDIEVVLQRDLNKLIKDNLLGNEPRDISWLKEQIKASVFDLYAVVKHEGKTSCFGCIQSKTSIRDRTTRDREPSINAMKSFFWSTIVVLDGEFLEMPKFTGMVNGKTPEYKENGWHGMYVFSGQGVGGRIYAVDIDFDTFKQHATQAASFWLKQRQWFNSDWIAK